MGVAEEEKEMMEVKQLKLDYVLLLDDYKQQQEEIRRLKMKLKQLEGNFSHFHVDNEMNELCALCGLAVINAVHLRSR